MRHLSAAASISLGSAADQLLVCGFGAAHSAAAAGAQALEPDPGLQDSDYGQPPCSEIRVHPPTVTAAALLCLRRRISIQWPGDRIRVRIRVFLLARGSLSDGRVGAALVARAPYRSESVKTSADAGTAVPVIDPYRRCDPGTPGLTSTAPHTHTHSAPNTPAHPSPHTQTHTLHHTHPHTHRTTPTQQHTEPHKPSHTPHHTP